MLFNQIEFTSEKVVLWPIPLLIVDINMPHDGLQAVKHVKH